MGQPDEFMRLVASIPEDYPDGDMCGEALWQGARHTMDRGEPEKALDLLSRYYSLFPIEPGWYTAGRSGYWLARLEEQLGSLNDAISHYEYVIATAPLSYYMVLSYARLRELDSTRTELLLAQLAPATGSETDGIPARLVTSLSRFALGVELVRLGLLSRGKKVLQEELQRPDSHPELHRAAAALFRNAGRFTESREFSSSSADGWSERYPAGSDFASWSLAYPKAHEELVTAAAGESGVDPALLWAVMREESGFNATIESWANAVGLMQLILPTARAENIIETVVENTWPVIRASIPSLNNRKMLTRIIAFLKISIFSEIPPLPMVYRILVLNINSGRKKPSINKSCMKGTEGSHFAVSATEIKGRLEIMSTSDPRNIRNTMRLNDLR